MREVIRRTLRELPERLRPYRVALAATAAALCLSLLLAPWSDRLPFALCIAAVLVSAWHGGFRPAAAATGLATLFLLVRWLFLPAATAPGYDPEYLPRLGMFALIGLLAGYLIKMCRRAVEEVEWVHVTLDNLVDAVAFTDPKGKVTFLNPAAQALTGWSAPEAAGQPLELVFPLVHEDTRRPLEPAAARALAAGGGAVPEGPAVLLGKDGTARPVRQRAAPLRDSRGELIGVIQVCRDAGAGGQAEAERRRRAEQFEAAAAAAPAGLFLLDPAGRCTFTNAACQALCGFTPDEGLGEGWARAVHPDDRDRVVTAWVTAARAGRPYEGEFRRQPPQGEVRHLRLRAAPLRGDGDAPLGHVGVIEDLTGWKKTEEALREARAERDRADEAGRELEETRAGLEDQLRQRAAELDAAAAKLREQERAAEALRREHARLQEQLRERQRAEEALRKDQARSQELLREGQRAEEAAREAQGRLRQQLREGQQAEARLRADKEALEQLVEACGDGVVAFDRTCRYTVWNAAMTRLCGLDKAKALGGSAFEVFPFVEDGDDDSGFVQALEGDRVLARLRPADGRRQFEAHFAPLVNGAGDVTGGVAVLRDISGRDQGAADLEEQVAQLRAERDRVKAEGEDQVLQAWAERDQARADLQGQVQQFQAERDRLREELRLREEELAARRPQPAGRNGQVLAARVEVPDGAEPPPRSTGVAAPPRAGDPLDWLAYN